MEPPKPLPDRDRSTAFAKGLAVLAAFDDGAETLTLSDIARAAGQDRATARRGALTLVRAGYLMQQGREFRLAPKVLELAGGFLRANRFGTAVQPVLNRHAEALGTEITLATRQGVHVLLLAQSTVAQGPVSQGFTPGSRLPLLHTSLGRMLLAGEDDDGQLLARAPMIRHTDAALTDRSAVAEQIKAARQQGFAVTMGEFEPGIVGLAVGLGAPGRRALAVGASKPSGALLGNARAHLLAGLQLCAAELRQGRALDAL